MEELSKRNIKTIRTCLILRMKELATRKGHETDYRITDIKNVLEKLK